MQASIRALEDFDEYYFKEGCHITEVSNSDDDPQLSIAQARVEPAITTAWHKLDDTVERYVLTSGSGVVEVDDKEAVTVKAGDVVIIPADTKQRIWNNGEVDLVFMAICTPRFRPENYQALE